MTQVTAAPAALDAYAASIFGSWYLVMTRLVLRAVRQEAQAVTP